MKYKLLISSFLLSVFLSCEKKKVEPDADAEKSTIYILPAAWVAVPDTVSRSVSTIDLEFYHVKPSSYADATFGYDIVSESENHISLKLKLLYDKKGSSQGNDIYYYTKIPIDITNKIDFKINFLNDTNKVVLTRSVVLTDMENTDYIIEYNRRYFGSMSSFYDTSAVILHDSYYAEESSYRDTIFSDTITNFRVSSSTIDAQYDELYYSIVLFTKSCDKSNFKECSFTWDGFTPGKVKRGIPKVLTQAQPIDFL